MDKVATELNNEVVTTIEQRLVLPSEYRFASATTINAQGGLDLSKFAAISGEITSIDISAGGSGGLSISEFTKAVKKFVGKKTVQRSAIKVEEKDFNDNCKQFMGVERCGRTVTGYRVAYLQALSRFMIAPHPDGTGCIYMQKPIESDKGRKSTVNAFMYALHKAQPTACHKPDQFPSDYKFSLDSFKKWFFTLYDFKEPISGDDADIRSEMHAGLCVTVAQNVMRMLRGRSALNESIAAAQKAGRDEMTRLRALFSTVNIKAVDITAPEPTPNTAATDKNQSTNQVSADDGTNKDEQADAEESETESADTTESSSN